MAIHREAVSRTAKLHAAQQLPAAACATCPLQVTCPGALQISARPPACLPAAVPVCLPACLPCCSIQCPRTCRTRLMQCLALKVASYPTLHTARPHSALTGTLTAAPGHLIRQPWHAATSCRQPPVLPGRCCLVQQAAASTAQPASLPGLPALSSKAPAAPQGQLLRRSAMPPARHILTPLRPAGLLSSPGPTPPHTPHA